MKLIFTDVPLSEHNNGLLVSKDKDIELGLIVYRKSWKCWVWEQFNDIDMSASCLIQVLDWLQKLDTAENLYINTKSSKSIADANGDE